MEYCQNFFSKLSDYSFSSTCCSRRACLPPCAAGRTGPLRVVAGRAMMTSGVSLPVYPTRSAYAPHALFWRRGSTGRSTHAFLRRSLRDRSCIPSPVQARQPRIAGAVDAPEKAYDAENSQAARPKGKCCRANPSPLRILPVIGRVMRRRGGAAGRQGPDLIPRSLRYHKTFDGTWSGIYTAEQAELAAVAGTVKLKIMKRAADGPLFRLSNLLNPGLLPLR